MCIRDRASNSAARVVDADSLALAMDSCRGRRAGVDSSALGVRAGNRLATPEGPTRQKRTGDSG
eukprot:11769376-Alexandrium_andersonii.AAC.1